MNVMMMKCLLCCFLLPCVSIYFNFPRDIIEFNLSWKKRTVNSLSENGSFVPSFDDDDDDDESKCVNVA